MTRLSPKSEGLDTVMMIRQRKITKHILIDENPLENSIRSKYNDTMRTSSFCCKGLRLSVSLAWKVFWLNEELATE